MLKFTATVLAAAFAITATNAAETPSFQVGQMWTVKDSTTIRIVVGRIEPFPGEGTAVSVSVFGVPCPPAAGCTTTIVAHAPFDSETLAASVDKLVVTDAPTAPNFEAGYTNWKQAKGGVFTIPVSRLPDILFKALPTGVHIPNE